MFEMTRGTPVPARTVLLALALVLAVAAAIGAYTGVRLDPLETESGSALPLPKGISSLLEDHVGAAATPYRLDLDARVPASLNAVLAFYRAELGKRGWTEASEHAVIKPDRVWLAFSSPDGPAVLQLGRSNGLTMIHLAQKIPAVAAKEGVMPKPGQANLSFINAGQGDATFTINEQTIRIAAGRGVLPDPSPTIGLPPGKYRYSLQIANGPVQNNEIELTADDNTGLAIDASGQVTLEQIY